MQKSELLELFESAEKAADAMRGSDAMSSPDASRCVDALERLKKAPPSLTHDVIYTTTIGKRLRALTKHTNPKIQSAAKSLLDMWRKVVVSMNCTTTNADKKSGKASKVEPVRSIEKRQNPKSQAGLTTDSSVLSVYRPLKTVDPMRDKVRGMLEKALAKVATEANGKTKERVLECNPSIVSESLEAVMFEKLGPFNGPKKLRYRSILFNMGDTNNPDLRRKVLLGEVSGERLITMDKEELGSEKMQEEYRQIKDSQSQRRGTPNAAREAAQLTSWFNARADDMVVLRVILVYISFEPSLV